jgi:hypothetical protein
MHSKTLCAQDVYYNGFPPTAVYKKNEEADKMAKQGAEKAQTYKSISLSEINTMIKSISLNRQLPPIAQAGASHTIPPANRSQQKTHI